MDREIKTCQNCKTEFTIEPDDFVFYEKIKVPPPTWCPECRLKRRLIVYDKRAIYKRKCDLCGKETLSMYDAANPIKVFCNKCWWSDAWDPTSYGREYDFSKPFFLQLRQLLADVPWMALGTDYPSMVNSDYCNAAGNLKNCYLVFYADYAEDSYYCDTIDNVKDCFDCFLTSSSEQCYGSVNIKKCFRAFYSVDCEDSHDIIFSRNLMGCSYCFGCTNLRNKQYHIFNKQYGKEEYLQVIKNLNFPSYQNLLQTQKEAEKFFQGFPVKYFHGRHNVNVLGDYIENSKNTHFSFLVKNAEDSKWCFNVYGQPTKDCYDYSIFGENASQVYESIKCGYDVNNLKFCNGCWSGARDLQYSTSCITSSNLFACIGLRNKSYCIINKQYTKEEYEKMISQIIDHMNSAPYVDKKGRVYKYGEFFPPELSTFAYNEAITQEYFPLIKEQALEQGYSWKDPEERHYNVTKRFEDLPDNIKDTPDSIVNEIIGCIHEAKCNEQCTTAFRIIPQELEFYRKMNLPLPRLCPNCRHYQRIKQRNPLKLWHRKCMCAGITSDLMRPGLINEAYRNQTTHFHGQNHCPNEFETSYAPEKPEIVYCEQCYQNEAA